jgi:hypothetical protein
VKECEVRVSAPFVGMRAPAMARENRPVVLRLEPLQVVLRFHANKHLQEQECMASRRPHLTRRSSGPRGQSIVFPAILSARGRLTRR